MASQKVLQGAARPFGYFEVNITGAIDAYFSILGNSSLYVWDDSFVGTQTLHAGWEFAKHNVDFGCSVDRLTIKIDGNRRSTSSNYRIRKVEPDDLTDILETEQWVQVPANRMGTFICTGEAATVAAGGAMAGYQSSAVPAAGLNLITTLMATCELLPDSGYHTCFRVGGGETAFLERDYVPPPAWMTFPLCGSMGTYYTEEPTLNVIGDLEDTQKPLQSLVRARGTLTYIQGFWDYGWDRALLVYTDVNALPEPGDDKDQYLAWGPPDDTGQYLAYVQNGDGSAGESAAIGIDVDSGDLASISVFDVPVGSGYSNFWSVGMNWEGAPGNRFIDHFSSGSDWTLGDAYNGGQKNWDFVGAGGEKQWYACPIGAYTPYTQEEVENLPLGWNSVECLTSFSIEFSKLRAYRAASGDGEDIRVAIARNSGAVGNLFADTESTVGWYEDTENSDSIQAEQGWCYRFSAPVAASSAAASISMIGVTYADSTNRDCLVRVLPNVTVVNPLPRFTRLSRSVDITRLDGEVFAYTEHDRDIVHNNLTYKTRRGFQGSASELGSVIGDVGNMEVQGYANDLGIKAADLFGGKFDGAIIRVWLLPWGEDNEQSARRIGGGVVGDTRQFDRAFVLEALSPSAWLSQKALLEHYTPSCRYELGSTRCTVAIESMRVTSSVTGLTGVSNPTGVSVRRRFIDANRVEEDDFFVEGLVTFHTGANAGQTSKVKAFVDGETVLWEPLIYPIEVGDEYSMLPGCDKLEATCRDRFGNHINFGGYPDIPGLDAAAETPSNRMGE